MLVFIKKDSLAFSSGHLAAGQSANTSRIAELLDIIGKNFSNQKPKKFQDHNIFFVFGDLNFRLDLDNNSVRRMIENNSLDTLIVYDQFLKTKNINFNLNCLDEGNLNFKPTYKYNTGTNEYDSKAKRTPSWCDRILFKKTKLIKQICYNRCEYNYSDHKPVYSIFELTILKEKKEEKNKLINYLRRALILGFDIKKKISEINLNEENLNSNNYSNWRFIQQNKEKIMNNINSHIEGKNGIPNQNIYPNYNTSNK